MTKVLCNSKVENGYCTLSAGFGTSHPGEGPCTNHEQLTVTEIHEKALTTKKMSPEEESVMISQAVYSIQPILDDAVRVKEILNQMILEYEQKANPDYKEIEKFFKVVQRLEGLLKVIQKTINDKELLELRKEQVVRKEQDWKVAYAAIDFIMQRDPELANRTISYLRSHFDD
jgi:hypothetical protein